MVTVFGILNLTEDSFFDESRRLDPAGAVTAAIEMLRVGSDVVDVGPAASHPDARPVSPADEIRRIAPLLDALSDQMHKQHRQGWISEPEKENKMRCHNRL
ncbi:hypothetical protein AWF46_27195 [Escherichia coli]|nr:hypothetical protein AWF46_27195 [Escherichia coli]